MTTTAIEITYVFDDGRRVAMGSGTIDEMGQIDITDPAKGQEDYIKREMDELNARDNVILKEPPTEDQPQFSLNKRKVYRGDPDFLSALKDYGERVYAMEFAFDIESLQPEVEEAEPLEEEELSTAAEDPDAPSFDVVDDPDDIEEDFVSRSKSA